MEQSLEKARGKRPMEEEESTRKMEKRLEKARGNRPMEEEDQDEKIEDADEKIDWLQELFTNGVNDAEGHYKVEKCIGDIVGAKVYKAAYKSNETDRQIDVALKLTLMMDEDSSKKRKQEVHMPLKLSNWSKKLDEEAERSFSEGNQENGVEIQNIIGIKNRFISKHFLCVSMPLFEEGSLRHILWTRFNNGLPEDCVAIALRETAMGLFHLHEEGLCHKNVNSGLIFVSRSPVRIGLAYEGSNFYYNPIDSLTRTMINTYPVSAQNSFWSRNRAHAPEISDPNDQSEYYPSSDIWGLGLAALELFYGCLPEVQFHEDLKVLRDYVTEIEILPKLDGVITDMLERKEAELMESRKTIMQMLDMFDDCWHGMQRPVSPPKLTSNQMTDVFDDILDKNVQSLLELSTGEKEVGRSGKAEEDKAEMLYKPRPRELFTHFVSSCLELNPEERATAEELLNHPFLEDCKDLRYFEDVVLKGLLPSQDSTSES